MKIFIVFEYSFNDFLSFLFTICFLLAIQGDPPAYCEHVDIHHDVHHHHHHDTPHYHESATQCDPPPYSEHANTHHQNIPHYPTPIPSNVYESLPNPNANLSPLYVPEEPTQSVNVAGQKNEGALWNARNRSIARTNSIIFVFIAIIIIIAVLCWRFGTATSCQVSCGTSSNCVLVSQWCDGVNQCPNGADESNCMRMYGPNFQLQAYSPNKATWLPVCADFWTENTGQTACQDIGYSLSSYSTSDKMAASSSDGFVRLSNYAVSGKIFANFNYSSTCSSGHVVSLRCIDCGLTTNGDSRIVGGNSASIGEWPWQVNLQYDASSLCGGSIIAANWIVTAAHCVDGDASSPSLWKAFVGKLVMPSNYDSSAYYVDKIIVHPNYSSQTKHNDIALMKLKKSIVFNSVSRPVCLPNYGMQWEEGQECWISGWGTTSQGGSISTVLKKAMVPLISPTTCNKTYMYNGAITSSMICAGYAKGGVDSCQGDSGGPLVTKTNSLWWLIGDTSWGDGCAKANKPGVYGNMTVFLQWIYLQMQSPTENRMIGNTCRDIGRRQKFSNLSNRPNGRSPPDEKCRDSPHTVRKLLRLWPALIASKTRLYGIIQRRSQCKETTSGTFAIDFYMTST
ncbi:hypothetical protein XELAEV_18011411mg, partial [Xenopus laevis]